MQRNESDLAISMLRCQFNRTLHEDSPTYFKEDMALAVDRIKKSRLAKSSDFNCVVIGDYSGENEELSEFLKELNDNRDSIKDGSRFAILFCYKETHWVAIDCQYTNNQFQFFVIDAAIYSFALEETILTITQQLSDANITYLELNEDTKIQRCHKECGTFSLDILSKLATISNLYELIHSLSSSPVNNFALTFKEQVKENKLHRVTVYDLPIELGCIIRNMHSVSLLTKLTNEKKYMASSHKLLVDYFNAHIKEGQNLGIEIKRKSIKANSLTYYTKLSNFDIQMLLMRNEKFICYLKGEIIELDNVKQKAHSDVAQENDPYSEFALTPGYVGQAIMEFFTSGFRLFFSDAQSGKINADVGLAADSMPKARNEL